MGKWMGIMAQRKVRPWMMCESNINAACQVSTNEESGFNKAGNEQEMKGGNKVLKDG